MKKLCLNMIVKNEAANLRRCLGSLAQWISCYAISDTGSTDATIEMTGQLLFDKPGTLSSIPFVNFGQARNAAYQTALASNLEFDYIILADADWQLVVTEPHCFDNLTEPVYSIKTQDPPGKFEYALTRLVRRDVALKFVGVTHEYPDTRPHPVKFLEGCHFVEHPTGASRPTKFQRDIKLLTEGLKTEPQNQRYKYYLGESHYWLAKYDEALRWYQKCLDGPTWEFDAWHPGFRIAQILQIKGMTADFIAQCLALFDKFPHRAESIAILARHYQQAQQYRIGYELASLGLRIPRPSGDTAHVQTEVYSWELKDIAAICAYYVGKKDESRRLNEEILPIVPESERNRIATNLAFCMPELMKPAEDEMLTRGMEWVTETAKVNADEAAADGICTSVSREANAEPIHIANGCDITRNCPPAQTWTFDPKRVTCPDCQQAIQKREAALEENRRRLRTNVAS